jgi:hypothetical protein
MLMADCVFFNDRYTYYNYVENKEVVLIFYGIKRVKLKNTSATLKATQSEQHMFVRNRLGWMIVRFLVAAVFVDCGGTQRTSTCDDTAFFRRGIVPCKMVESNGGDF